MRTAGRLSFLFPIRRNGFFNGFMMTQKYKQSEGGRGMQDLQIRIINYSDVALWICICAYWSRKNLIELRPL